MRGVDVVMINDDDGVQGRPKRGLEYVEKYKTVSVY